MSLRIEKLAASDGDGFAGAYSVYRTAIDPSEQKSRAALHRQLRRSDNIFLVAKRSQRIVGMAVLYVPPRRSIWLLEYLAVDNAERSQGLGARLFEAGLEAVGANRIALVEVDSDLPPGPTRAMRKRRLGFYARLGCRRLAGLDYILPLRTRGRPPPMALLARAPQRVRSIPRPALRRWLSLIYTQVYGQAPQDPRIARMLAPLPANIALRA